MRPQGWVGSGEKVENCITVPELVTNSMEALGNQHNSHKTGLAV